MIRRALLAAFICLIASAAIAGGSSPGLTTGQVPTAAQWNSYFAAKQDYVVGSWPFGSGPATSVATAQAALSLTPGVNIQAYNSQLTQIAGGTWPGAASITTIGSLAVKLNTLASSTSTAGLNCPQGAAPTSPVNGDVWCTSAGMFVRIAGSTVGPLIGASGGAVLSVSNSDSTLTISPTTGNVVASLNLAHANAFTALQAVNLNAGALPSAQVGAAFQISNAAGTQARYEADSYAAAAYFSGVRRDGTVLSPSTLQSGDEVTGVNLWGYNSSAVVGPKAAFRLFADQNWTTGANGTYADIATTPDGSTTLTSVVKIGNDGSVNLLTGSLLNNGTVPTGTGGYVRATTPSLVTPVLGAATGTSLALGGASIGGNALAVTGTTLFNSSVTYADASVYSGTGLAGLLSLTITPTAAATISTDQAQASGGSTTLAFSTVSGVVAGQIVAGTNIPLGDQVSSTQGTVQVTLTGSGTSASGQKVITTTNTTGAVVGQQVADITSPSAIGAGNVIASISAGVSITMTSNLTGNVSGSDVLHLDPTVTLTTASTGTIGASASITFTTNHTALSSAAALYTTGDASVNGNLNVGGPIFLNSGKGTSGLQIGATNNTIYATSTNQINFNAGGVNLLNLFASPTVSISSNDHGLQKVLNGSSQPLLEVLNNSATLGNNGASILSYRASATVPATLIFGQSNSSTLGTQAAVASGTRLGDINTEGSDGTNFQDATSIRGLVDGSVSAGIVPGKLSFLTANSSGVLTDAMDIRADQGVIVGAATDQGAGTLAALNGLYDGANRVATLAATSQALTGGVLVTGANLGTVSSGTTTIVCGSSPQQYLTDNGAFTLAAPAADSNCIVKITNGASAGAITFSGFSVGSNTGDALDTTNGHKFMIFIARINGDSTYSVKALQ